MSNSHSSLPQRLLLLGALAAVLLVVAFVELPGTGTTSSTRVAVQATPSAVSVAAPLPKGWVDATSYLPSGAVQDGSVDYTSALQQAIDAASGRVLVLPPFPVLVRKPSGKQACLSAKRPIEIRGSPSSLLLEKQGAVQVLRVEGADDVVLRDFGIVGKGGNGASLGHGLLQVNGGARITIDNVRVLDSDADGIAVANARSVVLKGCRAERCSKSALYVNNCDDALIDGCISSQSGGHVSPKGTLVGAAVQLSSCRNAIVRGCVLENGIGIGIKCDALAAGTKPYGCVIDGNRIQRFTNTTNPEVSSGIRLENANADKATHTLVRGNSVQGCGSYGIYVEHHAGAFVCENTVLESEASGIVISHAQDVLVRGNQVLNSNTAQLSGQTGIYLVNQAQGVVLRDNWIAASAQFAPCGTWQSVMNGAADPASNQLERRERFGLAPPSAGMWGWGDVWWNTQPQAGAPLGWVCVAPGIPGLWAEFGKL